MKYKIGDISKILNISVDTLRFYVSKGIISPAKGAENKYSYYSEWDIYDLMEYQKLRSSEFSVSEILEIKDNDNLQQFTARIKNKSQHFEERANFYQRLYQFTIQQQNVLYEAQHQLWQCNIVEYPGFHYLLHNGSKDVKRSFFEEWNKYFAFVNYIIHIDLADIRSNQKDGQYIWGFAMEKPLAETLGITFRSGTEFSPPGLALHTIIDAGTRGSFSYSLLDKAFASIHENGYTASGGIIGNYLVRLDGQDGYARYIEVWIPVKKT